MAKEWVIRFSENGEEYEGTLVVTAKKLYRINERTVIADGVRLALDEYITGIEPDAPYLKSEGLNEVEFRPTGEKNGLRKVLGGCIPSVNVSSGENSG